MKFAVEYEMDQSEARIKTDVSGWKNEPARLLSDWHDAYPDWLSPRRLWVSWVV